MTSVGLFFMSLWLFVWNLPVAVVRTRPQAIPLAMITMRKSTHGFPFPLRAAGAPPLTH